MPSSVVAAMHYDADLQVLKIIYTSGNVYDYLNVPASEYKAIKTAPSKGTYLNEVIKTKYKYVKVK